MIYVLHANRLTAPRNAEQSEGKLLVVIKLKIQDF